MAQKKHPKGKPLPTTKKAPTGHTEGQQGQQSSGVIYRYTFTANEQLNGKLEAITKQRKRSRADTVRMLVYMGLEVYNNNQTAGITTGHQAAQRAARHRAEAKAEGQHRQHYERPTSGPKHTPTAMLIDDEQRRG